MKAVKGVFGWLGRKGIVFVALVAAILIYESTKPSFDSLRKLRREAAELQAGADEFTSDTKAAVRRADRKMDALYLLGQTELGGRIRSAQVERDRLGGACRSDLVALASGGSAGVIDNRKRCIRAALLTREIATLTAFRDSLDARRPGETLPAALGRQGAEVRRQVAVYRACRVRYASLDHDYVPDLLQRAEMNALAKQCHEALSQAKSAKQRADLLSAADRRVTAATKIAWDTIATAKRSLDELVRTRVAALGGNALQKASLWAEANDLRGVLKRAALALTLIIATPYLIRLFCWGVLAPAAMRRPAIRVGSGAGSAAAIPLPAPSTTSVTVRLEPGEELLVRQDYLQSASHAGAKATQWFLSRRHLVTSIATGLTFLTRIRGAGESTTVSAARDPFAEVTILTLPEGTSCVLQPRALVAAAQPIDRPLRIRTRWQAHRLTAWLTMQLRYVVFPGPARLVVKGSRGVRVERAERGRVFAQDQLVGFSTDLAYSVARSETFWPYFLGREALLKDRVDAGEGVLIVEEAPLAGYRAGEVRHGIEGLIDAGLKVFGL